MVANLVRLVWWKIKTSQLESTLSAIKQRAHSVFIRIFKNLPGFIYTNFFFPRGTFVDYSVAILYPYEDTMCLGSLGTIGPLRPDSSVGPSST